GLTELPGDAGAQADVVGAVVAAAVPGEEDARELVEREPAVRLRVAALPDRHRRLGVAVGGERAAGERAAGDVHRRGQPAADVEAPIQRLAHVADTAQVGPDVAAADAVVVAVQNAGRGRVGPGPELLVDRLGGDHARA